MWFVVMAGLAFLVCAVREARWAIRVLRTPNT